VTTATTQFTFLRFVDATGALVWHVVHATLPLGVAYRTGRGGRVWRVAGTRGAYRTRHAAACAALAQRDDTTVVSRLLDACESSWEEAAEYDDYSRL
jgi:hypothetical protein